MLTGLHGEIYYITCVKLMKSKTPQSSPKRLKPTNSDGHRSEPPPPPGWEAEVPPVDPPSNQIAKPKPSSKLKQNLGLPYYHLKQPPLPPPVKVSSRHSRAMKLGIEAQLYLLIKVVQEKISHARIQDSSSC